MAPLPGLSTLKPGSSLRRAARPHDPRRRRTRRRRRARRGRLPRDRRHLAGHGPHRVGRPASATATRTGRASPHRGYFFSGDGAKVDADGDIWLLGRVDDVINVSGHRLSTIEIESALVAHPDVAEAGRRRRDRWHDGRGDRGVRRRRRRPRRASRRLGRAPPERRRAARARDDRDRPDREARATSCSSPNCRRPARARSCAACSSTSPRGARSATRRRCRTARCPRGSPGSSRSDARHRGASVRRPLDAAQACARGLEDGVKHIASDDLGARVDDTARRSVTPRKPA